MDHGIAMVLRRSFKATDVALFLSHMETYAQASGQRLNLRKSALIPTDIGDTGLGSSRRFQASRWSQQQPL